MKYTEPKILRIEDAIAVIQQVSSNASSKPSGAFSDSHNPPVSCTINAYEADE
jgi:hypothetical protein